MDQGVLGQFLKQRVPVHFGGMSDPFQPIERRFQVSARFLEALAEFDYPTVISTRSTLPATEPYLSILRRMRHVVVQFSLTSTRESVARKIEPLTPGPGALLSTMEVLRKSGVQVTCRWQPYVPGTSEAAAEFVTRVASAGALHVAFEHLKLPVETGNSLWDQLVRGAGRDLRREYAARGATRQGREYVLPAREKLEAILQVRHEVQAKGMTFGAADNEFQYLSDSSCCCSGVDLFPGFGQWYKHQIGHAVRLCRGQRIVYGSIASFWTPAGSVNRYLNSHSRIEQLDGGTVTEHIRTRWNDKRSALSPSSFFGVVPTNEFTRNGYRVYRWDDSTIDQTTRASSGL